jgi:hypothetical protein
MARKRKRRGLRGVLPPGTTLPIIVASLASFGVFTTFLLARAKAKEGELAALGEQLAPQIAEAAVRRYINERFGFTPERLQSITSRVNMIQSLTR